MSQCSSYLIPWFTHSLIVVVCNGDVTKASAAQHRRGRHRQAQGMVQCGTSTHGRTLWTTDRCFPGMFSTFPTSVAGTFPPRRASAWKAPHHMKPAHPKLLVDLAAALSLAMHVKARTDRCLAMTSLAIARRAGAAADGRRCARPLSCASGSSPTTEPYAADPRPTPLCNVHIGAAERRGPWSGRCPI